MLANRRWMGMWQIHQFANVVKKPIRVVHPIRNARTRCEYNRCIYPEGYIASDHEDELNIICGHQPIMSHIILNTLCLC